VGARAPASSAWHAARALAVASVLAFQAASCEPPPPEFVYVRDPESAALLEIAILSPPDSLVAGAWIRLRADRETGRWLRVARRDLEPGRRWLPQPPPAREERVESGVTWRVEPAAGAEFNMPMASDLSLRQVRFAAPGTFSLWATSHTWDDGTVASETLLVRIHP
jgi:hypothetical protein